MRTAGQPVNGSRNGGTDRFNGYRSNSENGEYVKLNERLLPDRGSAARGPVHVRRPGVVRGETYYYQVENVMLDHTTVDGNQITLALQSALNWDDATTITLTTRVDEDFDEALLANTAAASSGGLDVNANDNVDSAIVLVRGAALNLYLPTVHKAE